MHRKIANVYNMENARHSISIGMINGQYFANNLGDLTACLNDLTEPLAMLLG